ncbi:MAG: tetratricopeptide repeat protein [Chloroflexota bacterium]
MHINRNYSRPFFSSRRRSGIGARGLFVIGLVLGGIVVFFLMNFSQIQLRTLDAFGMAPTPTPFASDQATRSLQMFATGNLEGALVMMADAVDQRPNNIDYLYEYGMMLYEAERFDEALQIAERAIAAAPEDPRGYALKARGLMWSDPPAAIQVAIQGTDTNPDFAPLYAAQGIAYTNLGRWQEGLRMGARAIELDPNNLFVQMSYQFPLIYRGDYRRAIEAVETAIALNPNLPGLYFYLARLYSLPQVGEPEMAIATYERIIEMDPDNAKAYLRLCQVYAGVENARFDIAQPYCDAAIQIDPTYGDAYAQRGQMQYVRRNYEGAIQSFEQCIENGSEQIECWYLRGFSYYRLGECDLAWEITNEARPMAVEQGLGIIVENIDNVLDAITQRCPNYEGLTVPTPIPPTPIPPTPIGGFG